MGVAQQLARAVDGARAPLVSGLAAARVHPNHVTVFGVLIAAAAGYLVANGALLVGGVVFAIGSLLDGLDGALARKTGTASRFGAFLDSVCDRIGEGLLLLGVLAYALNRAGDSDAILAFAAFMTSMLVSYTRARAEGLGLHGKSGLAPRPVRIVIVTAGLLLPGLLTLCLVVVTLLAGASTLQRMAEVWRQTRQE